MGIWILGIAEWVILIGGIAFAEYALNRRLRG